MRALQTTITSSPLHPAPQTALHQWLRALNDALPYPVWYYVYNPRLHWRSDDSGWSSEKRRQEKIRAAAVNIVPNSTGAAKAIGLVIPELNGKLIGSAQRVPTPTGSTTILTAVVKGQPYKGSRSTHAMKAASNESFGYNTDEIVSSDIVGMRYGSLFDATQTMVLPINDEHI